MRTARENHPYDFSEEAVDEIREIKEKIDSSEI